MVSHRRAAQIGLGAACLTLAACAGVMLIQPTRVASAAPAAVRTEATVSESREVSLGDAARPADDHASFADSSGSQH